jgi:hypothetical protein
VPLLARSPPDSFACAKGDRVHRPPPAVKHCLKATRASHNSANPKQRDRQIDVKEHLLNEIDQYPPSILVSLRLHQLDIIQAKLTESLLISPVDEWYRDIGSE